MTTIVLGCDKNGKNDKKYQNTVASMFKKAGYKVEKLPIAPGPFANYGYSSKAKGKIGVYIMAASLVSVTDLVSSGWHFQQTYFIIRGDVSKLINSESAFNSKGIPRDNDGDCNTAICHKWAGKTYPQINGFISGKGEVVYGDNAVSGANRVLAAMGGTQIAYSGYADGSGGTTSYYTGSLQGNSDSNISPLLQGEMTFQELVGEICNGIDILFLCKRSTIVVTDFESIFAEAKYLRDNHYSVVSAEDVKLWQLEEDSYKLEINQHGFYNTVYVNYKNGTVKETFQDLVKTFGEVSITYNDPTVNKTTAKMKAKAYLAAHLRDLEMNVEATILTEPDIDLGDIVTLDNPQSKPNQIKKEQGFDPEYLFVKGVNTSWDGDGYIQTDLELQFSPTSPSKKEVPTTGTYGTTNNTSNE